MVADLRKNEVAVLEALERKAGHCSIQELTEASGQNPAATMRALAALQEKRLVHVEEEAAEVLLSLTDEGMDYAKHGLPERRLMASLIQLGGEATIDEAAAKAGLSNELTQIALGWFRSAGWGNVTPRDGKLVLRASSGSEERDIEAALKFLAERPVTPQSTLPSRFHDAITTMKKRKLLLSRKQYAGSVELTEEGRRLRATVTAKGSASATASVTAAPPEMISDLTPTLIASGEWRKKNLRRYNIEAPVETLWPGKKQPYRRFLDELKSKLVALGFKEMSGPSVELMFFNCDALFMPQDHPAREIHDIYFVKSDLPGELGEYERFLNPVAKAHENGWRTGSTGWRYHYSRGEALKLILRSQGTALSARRLATKGLEIPGKYFSIVRCFRPDQVDRTHLTEFNQVEGIVVDPNLSLRDLLGVLERLAIDIAGADKIRFKPDYFPFTEPSVELQAFKEGYGWVELGGAGIFRPELTTPLGIDAAVIAWGIGVDRLFMIKAGLEDIRVLFSQDLDWLRKVRVV